MLLLKQPLSRTEIYNSVETSVNSDREHSKSLADEEGDYAEASELTAVSFLQNFDDVLVPEDHVSRGYNNTYYVDSHTVLRCHTRAHQAELFGKGHTHFLVTGDVYHRDSIDSDGRDNVFSFTLYLSSDMCADSADGRVSNF
ncbi:hypothetical protein RHSIM_Rhsim06G0102600 [Rhododendron simsii]|uniref:Phenylalanyl-tRNA synthetase domain-containing protein n=1 Tax=Rhododendron simsii TaxID=118357 RepID=A0A834GYH3_RHOSS|nr:hypothetical protein RHSIM_Rhsim06G0102600 [Rhododendron simsii]